MNDQGIGGAFPFIGNNWSLIVDTLGTHLAISGVAIAVSILLGVPLGLWLGHLHRFSFLAINVSNVGRALPSLGVLAILLSLVGIGPEAVVIALVVLAFPPILTNTYVAVDQVDAEITDAAKGVGNTPMQVLLRVELPLALPLIFAGIRTSAVFVIATATLGGIFGGGGMGEIINDQNTYKLAGVVGASIVLIAVAFLSQIVFLGIERLVTPAGLKLARGKTAGRLSRLRMEKRTLDNPAESIG